MQHYLTSGGTLMLQDVQLDAPTIVASIETALCGPIVRVKVEGERLPWEFSARGAAIRTPMRRRYTLARAVEFVRSRLEAQQPAAIAA